MTTTTKKTTTKKRRRRKAAGEPDLSHIIEALRPLAVPVDELHLDTANPNTHPDRNIEAIAESMGRFGQDQPIIFRAADNVVIKGEGRLIAAKMKLGWKHVAAVAVDDGRIQALARGVADNQAAATSKINEKALALVLTEIREADEGLVSKLGWTEAEINTVLGKLNVAGPGSEDDVDTLPKNPTTKKGDIWSLGEHLLICGDCTDPAVLERLMGNDTAQMVHTDPPYGVAYQATSGKHEPIAGDELTGDELLTRLLGPAIGLAAKHTDRTGALYIWHAETTRDETAAAMRSAGLTERTRIIWAKPSAGMQWSDYRVGHEACFYAGAADAKLAWYGDRTCDTVWRVAFRTGTPTAPIGTGVLVQDGRGRVLWITAKSPKKKCVALRLEDDGHVLLQSDDGESTLWEVGRDHKPKHPTQKPVELARRAIVNSSKPGDIVLDLFGGSGSTLIAAESTQRACRTVELHRGYCDLIVKRWERMTKGKAERVKRGRR